MRSLKEFFRLEDKNYKAEVKRRLSYNLRREEYRAGLN